MSRLINSIILFVVALILAFILFPLSFVITMVVRFDKYFLSDFFYSLALGIDKVGNVVLQVPLNAFAIKSHKTLKSYHFGNINDTISRAIAKNLPSSHIRNIIEWRKVWVVKVPIVLKSKPRNLTKAGWWLVVILEVLDEGHMEKSLNKRY